MSIFYFHNILILSTIVVAGCAKTAKESGSSVMPARKLPPVEGLRIGWDHSSLRRVSASNTARYSGYARLTVLPDKSLYCVYEESGNIIGIRSNDNGNSWNNPVTIAEKENGINMAVPGLLLMQNGALLICYNPRPYQVDTSRRFAIHTKISYDGGTNFTDKRVLYEAGYQFENGCWEPSAIQLPTGEIQLFFANEGVFPGSDEQNISMLKSFDNGKTWTQTPQVISFRQGRRDGMPAPLLNNSNEKIFVAIEDNAINTFKPYIISGKSSDNWSQLIDAKNPARQYALADKLNDEIYAGAPWLVQTVAGELILSYQGTENRINRMENADMKVVIGSEKGNDFNRKSVPFLVSPGSSCLWNSIAMIDDSTVVALCSTNAFSGNNTEVWMIKGKLMREQSIKKEMIVVDGKPNEYNDVNTFPHFLGHKGNSSASSILHYDEQYLYVTIHVKDQTVVNNGAAEFKEGVCIYLDPANHSYEQPDEGNYLFQISPHNQLAVKKAKQGKWTVSQADGINHTVSIIPGGYFAELGIPWSVLGGKPEPAKRIGFNMMLFDTDGNGKTYNESLGANDPDKPYCWSSFKL